MLLKRVSEDPLVGVVASRVLKHLVRDVVVSHSVRECLQTLPARPRVPTFQEVRECGQGDLLVNATKLFYFCLMVGIAHN